MLEVLLFFSISLGSTSQTVQVLRYNNVEECQAAGKVIRQHMKDITIWGGPTVRTDCLGVKKD